MTDRTGGPHRHRWSRPVVRAGAAVCVAMLAVAGCGDDDADPPTTEAPDSTTSTTEATTTTTEPATSTTVAAEGICEIITADDVLAALQVDVEDGVESEDDGLPVCSFEGEGGAAEVTVVLHDPAGDLLEDTLASDPTATEPSGVADGAVLQLDEGTITVRRNDQALVINAITPGATEVALVQLARVGAGHLQATP